MKQPRSGLGSVNDSTMARITLFPSQKGGRIDRTQFFRVFQAVSTAVGISSEKRHPHVLKHSLASHLVAGNVNLALVRQALGHRSITSTMQYVGTSDGQAAAAAQAALNVGLLRRDKMRFASSSHTATET
jgi:site-specific recombinase XerD